MAKFDETPPEGYFRWNGRLLAAALSDLQRRRSWCVSTDPEFAAKSADITRLYLGPPEKAIVFSVDEKPCIQVLEREQGWLKIPDDRALTGFAREYKRNGTTNLLAPLEVATGRVLADCFPRKRRDEFLCFLDRLVAENLGKELHLVLDNLSAQKLREDYPWRLRRPHTRFMNQ